MSNDFCQTWLELKERVTERFFFGVEGVDNDTRTVHMELQDPVGPVTYFACIGKIFMHLFDEALSSKNY